MSFSAPNPDPSGNEAKTDENREYNEDGSLHRTRTPSRSSNATRRLIKRAIQLRRSNPEVLRKPAAATLVKPPARYGRHGTIRALRKHVASANRQHLHDLFIQAYEKPDNDWASTLFFMLQHTPKADQMFSLKVVIGRGASHEARRVLSSLDNNINQIERRHQSVIKFEESFPDTETLVINISGTETAAHDSLRDIINMSGRVTAVKVKEDDLMKKLSDIWKDHDPGQPLSLDDDDGDLAASDTTMTVQSGHASHSGALTPPSRYKHYLLSERADNIPLPAEWTKVSFDKYVASLVYGKLPTFLAPKLYGKGRSHQQIVVSLLVKIFQSEDTRSAVSVSALKMALAYIHEKGAMFRPAARRIFTRAEELGLPLDAETFGLFLAGASRTGDLNNFNSILKIMVRKRFHVQSHAWNAFLEMTQHAKAKRIIIDKLEKRGLHRIPALSVGMARQVALLGLERSLRDKTFENIGQFVETYDMYGAGGKDWLNATTLNKLMDILGQHGRLDACHALLDYIYSTGRSATTPEAPGCGPDQYTLNTLLTHSRRLPDHAKLLWSMRGRWPWIKPDANTFNLLFAIAWTSRHPNTLRVLWHYALHQRWLTSKMRYRMSTLLRDEDRRNMSNRRFLLKAWDDVILGRTELREEPMEEDRKSPTPSPQSGPLAISSLEERLLAQANGKKPSLHFATKLAEAYRLDLEIHRLIKAGMVLTPALREKLAVDLPLREVPEEADDVVGLESESGPPPQPQPQP